ncbi:MAG: hypothetical protein CSA22_08575 [Deltaproteobacteria bacterium]|nr:MAG: hypothetical protein CSA22_08575 [Deltaproteobacteria bacterium]
MPIRFCFLYFIFIIYFNMLRNEGKVCFPVVIKGVHHFEPPGRAGWQRSLETGAMTGKTG